MFILYLNSFLERKIKDPFQIVLCVDRGNDILSQHCFKGISYDIE